MRRGWKPWSALGLVALLLIAALATVLVVAGCGSSGDVASPVAREATATKGPTEPPPTVDPCGDGLCDEVEQQNPGLCPEDCPPKATPTPTPTPTPPPTPEDKCGDGVCDEAEQKDPDLCPEDCTRRPPPDTEGKDPGEEQPPPASPSRARMWLKWRSAFGGCPGQQVDDVFADMEFSLSLLEDGSLAGTGEGTLYAEPVARCEGTDYGGLRTPDPYSVTVTSTVIPSGWMVSVTAQDRSEAHYTSGADYFEQCVLCWVMPEFKGNGIQGNATRFSLPRELLPGDSFLFEMDHQIPQSGWVNTHVGEGRVEILEVLQ